MTYEIITPKSVQKQILALSTEMILRIDKAILDLAENPRPDGVKKLKGSDRAYRLRVGDYRIIYNIYDKALIIMLVRCEHRREVYRK